MATPTSPEAWEYSIEFLKNNKISINDIYKTTGFIEELNKYKYKYKYKEPKMSYDCYCTRDRMKELQRCGCRQCRDEYYRLERDYHYNRGPSYADYNLPIAFLNAPVTDKITSILEKKMEEPKNIAIKMLVNKLKVEQAGLTSTKSTIEIYKTQRKTADDNIKTQNRYKSDKEKAIKELSVALKKLGHKE